MIKIDYLGHSCFLLRSQGGVRIVTDPFGSIGYPLPPAEADIVTVSHGHYDHCNVAGVGGAPRVIRSTGRYTAGDVLISAVESFHDDAQGRKRGGNLIFRFETEGLTVCHLGDLGEPCTAQRLADIHADVLLIPVGGHYTIGAEEAMKYVARIAPAAVIPMHYYTAGLQVDIAGADEFLRRAAASGIAVERCGGSVELDARALEKNKTKILYMERICQ